MTVTKIIFLAYVGSIVLMSIITIIAYINDKKKAESGAKRTKEKTLLGLAVFNGALGALIGRIIAHHKTNKIYFSMVIYFSLLLQIAASVLLGLIAFVL